MLSLERVDLRDNRLTDPTEVARLTGVPYITEIFVHRNPFCKSYSNYRVTVFNLFRKTPGYSEDIKIDSTLPSSSERKQLVDRAPEPPSVPVVKPPPEDEMPPPHVPPKVVKAIDASDLAGPPRTSLHRNKSGKGSKKKKTPKRRVVELTKSEDVRAAEMTLPMTLPPSYTSSFMEPGTPIHSTMATAEGAPNLELPAKDVGLGDPTKSFPEPNAEIEDQRETAPVQATSPPEFDVTSDLYKKKIEALRQDFGTNWLSALGEEGWDAKSIASFPSEHSGFASPIIRPDLARTPSQGIVSGGRTLG